METEYFIKKKEKIKTVFPRKVDRTNSIRHDIIFPLLFSFTKVKKKKTKHALNTMQL